MYRVGKYWYQKIDWINTSFLVAAHLAALLGFWFLYSQGAIQAPTVVFSVVMAVLAGFSITAGYHRLFSHRTYKGSLLAKIFFLFFGAGAFQNSARKWSSDHRRHHKYVDTEGDPYNIKEGFLFAHIGWVLRKYDRTRSYHDVPDLDRDPVVRFQDKHYIALAIGAGLLFPTLVASLWGDAFGGFILAGWVRIVVNEHFTFSINSFTHLYGSQNYSDVDTSRDNWFFSLLTYGEGYHNYHHKFPYDYRNGIKAYHWDPAKWLIRLFSWTGLASDLKRAPGNAILKARLEMDEKKLLRKLERLPLPKKNISAEFIVMARMKFEKALAEFQTLKEEMAQHKKEKLEVLAGHLSALNERMEHLKKELLKAREALQVAMADWVSLCQDLGYSMWSTKTFFPKVTPT